MFPRPSSWLPRRLAPAAPEPSTPLGRALALGGFVAATVLVLVVLGGRLLDSTTNRVSGDVASAEQPPALAMLSRPPAPPAGPRPGADPFREPVSRRAYRRPGPDGVPMLAVVIDDIGHNTQAVRGFIQLGLPLTYSVLPGVRHAEDSALLLDAAGQEYILHMPMEPRGFPRMNPGPGPLLLGYSARTTRERLAGMLSRLPGAVGASNHMGSAYTGDPDKMAVVLDVLGDRGLFFLDSRTGNSDVPEAVAHAMGQPFLGRDVFLDNERDEARISRQLDQALRIARRRGRAVAIGHPYPQTRRVLARRARDGMIDGIRLVPLTRLVEAPALPHQTAVTLGVP